MMSDSTVHVRYMVDDVAAAVDFYTTHLGFTVHTRTLPAFADVIRGNLRVLLSGPGSSAGRPMPDGARPVPGGWNRIHLVVSDIQSELARLQADGVPFRNEMVTGPGGSQILIQDPAGNLIELFQPAGARAQQTPGRGRAGTTPGTTCALTTGRTATIVAAKRHLCAVAPDDSQPHLGAAIGRTPCIGSGAIRHAA